MFGSSLKKSSHQIWAWALVACPPIDGCYHPNWQQQAKFNISQKYNLRMWIGSVKVVLLEPDGGRGGHDGHAVTLNRGMLWAVGGSSSLLGGPTFSLNMPTISTIFAISTISTRAPLNNNSSIVGPSCSFLGQACSVKKSLFTVLARVWTWVIYLPETKKRLLEYIQYIGFI